MSEKATETASMLTAFKVGDRVITDYPTRLAGSRGVITDGPHRSVDGLLLYGVMLDSGSSHNVFNDELRPEPECEP